MSLTPRFAVAMSVVVSAAMLVPRTASANITIEDRLEDPFTGILTLIGANLTVDLLLISLAVYFAFLLTRKRLGDIAHDPKWFVVLVALASVAVAVAGGVIDFVFLYERVDDHYELRGLSAETVIPATAMILASIAVLLHLFVRIRPVICLAIGTAVALLSPAGWFLVDILVSRAPTLWYIIWAAITGCLALGVLVTLHSAHRRVYSGEDDRAYEGA